MLEFLQSHLFSLVELLKFILEAISALCILFGLVTSLRLVFKLFNRRRVFPFLDVRLQFGSWLALALEFQLGADILGTTITPSFTALGQLAAIAIIRTFLNYFLNKELEAESELQKHQAQLQD